MTVEEMRDCKRQYHLTNEIISMKSGVPLGTVQKIFSGETKNPGYQTMNRIEKLFLSLNDGKGSYGQKPCGHPNMLKENTVVYGSAAEKGTGKGSAYTVRDFFALPEDRRAELINGKFYDISSPSIRHQRIVGEVYLQLVNYLKKEHCSCEAFISPCAVQPNPDDERTILEPDVFVVCNPSKILEDRIAGAPDLVVEVLSPGTSSRDAGIKLNVYRDAGVREYWMIDPKQNYAAIYTLQEEQTEDGRTKKVYPFPEIHPLQEEIPVIISVRKLKIDLRALVGKTEGTEQ